MLASWCCPRRSARRSPSSLRATETAGCALRAGLWNLQLGSAIPIGLDPRGHLRPGSSRSLPCDGRGRRRRSRARARSTGSMCERPAPTTRTRSASTSTARATASTSPRTATLDAPRRPELTHRKESVRSRRRSDFRRWWSGRRHPIEITSSEATCARGVVGAQTIEYLVSLSIEAHATPGGCVFGGAFSVEPHGGFGAYQRRTCSAG